MKPKRKSVKKRASNYEKKLVIKGSFIDVIKVAVSGDKKAKRKPLGQDSAML